MHRNYWHARAQTGQRTLALAQRRAVRERPTLGFDDLEIGLVMPGVVGIEDPPRPDALVAVRECQAAGIRVKMVAGDHAATANAISARFGLGAGTASRPAPRSRHSTNSRYLLLPVINRQGLLGNPYVLITIRTTVVFQLLFTQWTHIVATA